MIRTIVAALCALACFAPRTAEAAVERYAVIIGNNRGLPEDEVLRYAESDASRV